MIQHDISSAHACASRHTLMQRRRWGGILLIVAGGMVLTCVALSLLPGLTACTLLIRCGMWYPLISFGVLFVVVGMAVARSRAALSPTRKRCFTGSTERLLLSIPGGG